MLVTIASLVAAPARLHGQGVSEETLLEKTAEGFYRAIERNDLAAYLSLWTAKQEHDKQFKEDAEKFLALVKERKYEHLVFSRIRMNGDQASMLVAFDFSYLVEKMNKQTNGHMFHNIKFVKENGMWKIFRRTYASDDLFDAIAATRTRDEATELLKSEKELVTAELIHKLNKAADKQAKATKAAPTTEMRADLIKDAFKLNDIALLAAAFLHDKAEVAWCHIYRAFIIEAKLQPEAALDNFQLALTLFREAKDQDGEARALYNMANTYRKSGESLEALARYEASLKISRAIDDLSEQMSALLGSGLAYEQLSRYPEAIDQYNVALKVIRVLGNKPAEVATRSQIGGLWRQMGRNQAALEQFEATFELARQMNDKKQEVSTLNDIGSIYMDTDRYTEALSKCRASLQLAQEIGFERGEAHAWVSIANISELESQHADALSQYETALKMAREVGDRETESSSLADIGAVYSATGRYTEAVAQLTQSLNIVRELGDKSGEWNILELIGAAYAGARDYPKAVTQYEASRKIADELKDIKAMMMVAQNEGSLLIVTGQYDAAIPLLNAALGVARANSYKLVEVTILNNSSLAYIMLGRDADALSACRSALELANSIVSISGEMQSYEVLGVLYERQKNWDKAAEAWREAIQRIELLRAHTKEQSLQTSFFESHTLPYQRLAQSLLELNQCAEAFAVSERCKARSLVDAMQGGKVNVLKAMTKPERMKEQELDGSFTALAAQLNGLCMRPDGAGKQLDALKQQLDEARSAYDAFRRKLFLTHPELQTQRAQFEPATLLQLNQSLFKSEPNLCLLSYLIGEDETILFVITRGIDAQSPATLGVHRLPITAKDLSDLVEELRLRCATADGRHRADLLPLGLDLGLTAEKMRSTSYQKCARLLYQTLIAPAEKELLGRTNIVIIPDGVLDSLPFQVTMDKDGRHLLEKYPISYAPSVTALLKMVELADLRRKEEQVKTRLLAIGLSSFSGNLKDKNLTAAENEVNKIAELSGVSPLTGKDATKERVKSLMVAARYLHFATHALLNEAAPMYSAIALTRGENDDGMLYAHELLDMELHAQMVVLSACETALGRQTPGEGILGLSWALFVAGTPTSVVTQWSVADDSTSLLMIEFYKRLKLAESNPNSRSKAEALRQAQLSLLRGNDYTHPYYWAPFIVVGNWR